MLPQNKRINLLRCILECWKDVRLELFSHKGPQSHCGFSSALTGVERCKAILQEYAGFSPSSNFADGSERFRTQYAQYRAVSLDHVLSPACDPHLPLPASNKQTAILVPATSHPFPLFRVVGSSAFSYVAPECTARVKQHASLAAGIRPTPTLRPDGSASIFQAGNPVIVPGIVCASVRRPKTQGLAISQLLREPSEGAFRGFHHLLWPRCVRHCSGNQMTILVRMMPIEVALLLARLLTVSRIEPGSNTLRGAGHAVLRTLYSRAHRIGLNEASWLLCGLGKNVSSDLLLVDVGRMFAQPAFELVVPLEQELERFADDVGRICADEHGVSVQVVSDFFLQANLKGCSFWLLQWCFQ